MLFKPELIEKIMAGEKTETRRVVKPNEVHVGIMPGARFSRSISQTITLEDGRIVPQRIKWQVGRDYAICPGRGKKGVGRIEVLGLGENQDVRLIGDGAAKAEGFDGVNAFLSIWIHINDHSAQACWDEQKTRWIWHTARRWHHSDEGDDFAAYLMARPAERYHAWVIEFAKVN